MSRVPGREVPMTLTLAVRPLHASPEEVTMGQKAATERQVEETVDEAEMESEAEETGTADEHYNLVSVLYHALQGAEACGTYIEDAEEAGDQELVDFFEEVQEENRVRAERAKELMMKRLTEAERQAA